MVEMNTITDEYISTIRAECSYLIRENRKWMSEENPYHLFSPRRVPLSRLEDWCQKTQKIGRLKHIRDLLQDKLNQRLLEKLQENL